MDKETYIHCINIILKEINQDDLKKTYAFIMKYCYNKTEKAHKKR